MSSSGCVASVLPTSMARRASSSDVPAACASSRSAWRSATLAGTPAKRSAAPAPLAPDAIRAATIEARAAAIFSMRPAERNAGARSAGASASTSKPAA